jgi:hypothetical protein
MAQPMNSERRWLWIFAELALLPRLETEPQLDGARA